MFARMRPSVLEYGLFFKSSGTAYRRDLWPASCDPPGRHISSRKETLRLLAELSTIFGTVLLPIITVVGLGALIQRIWPMDIPSLATLNLYIFVPTYLFVQVSESRLTWAEIGTIGVVVITPIVMLAIPLLLGLRKRGCTRETAGLIVVAGLFANAGNFGVPVAELAYGDAGAEIQSLCVMFANLSIFLGAYGIILFGQGHGWRSLLAYFRMPYLYVIATALVIRDTGWQPPEFIMTSADRVSLGMVPVALLTLGAQLATRFHWPDWSIVGSAMLLKLLLLPAITTIMVWCMGLWPWPGAQLILASAAPTAVNTLVLSIDLRSNPKAMADCVFWITIASLLTTTVLIAVLKATGGVPT